VTAVDFTSLRFSTNDAPARDRVAMWREVYGQSVLRLDIEPLPDIPFHADLKLSAFPGLRLVSGTIGGTRDSRTSTLLDDGNDDFGLAINVAGTSIVSQRQREATLGAGDAALMTCAEIGSFVRPTQGRLIGLRIPRAALAALVPNVEDSLILPIPRDAEALSLLISYIEVLEARRAPPTVELLRAVVVHIYDLIALTIGATRDVTVLAKGRGGHAAKLHAIKSDIAANLGHRNLSIGSLAMRHKVTPRFIQRLFESEGLTFTQFVIGRRLDYAYRALIDQRFANYDMSAIAFEAGFGDLSYFYRTFRRCYGLTPSDLRKAAQREKDGAPRSPIAP
jgi:AraC-like DNA-binding protein